MNSTARSPIMRTVAWQPPDRGMRGMIDASTTDSPCAPFTLQYWSTTAIGFAIGPHLARTGYVPGGSDGLTDIEVQGVVVGYDVIRGLDAVIGHVFVRIGFQECDCHADAFSHPALVVGMLEIPVVECGLYCGIGTGEPDVSGAIGQPESARDPGYSIGGNVTVERLGPNATYPFRPFIHYWGGPQQHVVDFIRA